MPPMPISAEEDYIPIAHQRIPQKTARTPVPLPSSPRDALGIPISKIKLSRSKSNKRVDVDGDTEPLSPSTPAFASARGVEEGLQPAKPKRKTVWGVLEGWWDLNLLERGKSMRRKN
jgi:hypothetical protein